MANLMGAALILSVEDPAELFGSRRRDHHAVFLESEFEYLLRVKGKLSY